VHETLSHDETLVHVPIMTTAGCEPPVIAATWMGCSVPVLQVLLSHGASVKPRSRCGATALHILAMPQKEVEAFKRPAQIDELTVPALANHLHNLETTVGHLVNWLHLGFGKAASYYSAAPVARDTENKSCALALSLLQSGADPAEVWNGLLPAEAARRSGQQCLANAIEHFMWRRAQRLLAKHRSKAFLLGCHNAVHNLISQFLTPSCPRCRSIVAVRLCKAEGIEGTEESMCS